jgi:hypothetical protein
MPALGKHDIRMAVAVEVAYAGISGRLGYRFERHGLHPRFSAHPHIKAKIKL